MKTKILGIVGGIGTALLPILSHAQAFSTSTASTAFGNVLSDVSVIMLTAITAILGLYAGLVGLGWGIRKFKAYVSGRKF